VKIVVIGGGAAGFFGAIAAAEAHPEAQVTLLEAGRDPLAKVRISGGGRCNVTHACFEPSALVQHYPRGGKALRGAFTRFQPRDTVEWFRQRGVELHTEADGRMFPTTNDSDTIVRCLMRSAEQAGVRLWTSAAVSGVERLEPGFRVRLRSGSSRGQAVQAQAVQAQAVQAQAAQGRDLECDRLLVATGSNPVGYRIASALGHEVMVPLPSLFTFNLKDPRLVDLAGVSVNAAKVKLAIASQGTKPILYEQTGPLLVTHWGLSGPAVLKLSAWAARDLHAAQYRADLTITWLPQYNLETLKQLLLQVKSSIARKSVYSNCPVTVPRRLWERLCQTVSITPELRWSDLSNAVLNRLIEELLRGEYAIAGKSTFKEEFVTCGGINLKQVDFKTLESRLCPGLYFAGEILDIDGVTGGFNFQSAWTTSWLAGQAMGGEITHP
jgi:predicted flavoprotein YhiN